MSEKKMKSISIVIVVISILLLSGCAPSNRHKLGMFHGKVIDVDTGKPIKGAVAHVTYKVHTSWMGGGVSHNMAVRETLTDAKGEYLISEEIAIIDTPFTVDFIGHLQIYYPGHGNKNLSCPDEEKEVIYSSLGVPVCVQEEGKYLIWELSKLKTNEERRNNLPYRAGDIPIEQQILLMQAINEERYYLGYDLSDLPEGYALIRNFTPPPPPQPPPSARIIKVKQLTQKCDERTVHHGIGKSIKVGIPLGDSLKLSQGYYSSCDEKNK